MNQKENPESGFEDGNNTSRDAISSLITELGSEDGIVRVKARNKLANIGHDAIELLVEALSSKQEWLRWEAAKTIAQIGDPSATQTLIEALHDKEFDIRWLAAEGLIHIGNNVIKPLLEDLIEHSDSLWIREGAHHILHGLPDSEHKELLKPVLRALEDVEPSLEVAVAAEKTLNLLKDAGV